jgi:hypothetical protein
MMGVDFDGIRTLKSSGDSAQSASYNEDLRELHTFLFPKRSG